jgi:O-antigen/teichoic acid export membrane protein
VRDEAVEVRTVRTRRDRALVRAFLSGIAFRLIGPFFGAAAVAVGTRGLGDAGFGVVAALVSVSTLVGFADLGVGLGLMTRLASADGRDDAHEMRVLVSSAWVTFLLSGAAIAAGGLTAALTLPWQRILGAQQMPADEVVTAVLASFLIMAVAVPAGLGQRILTGLQRGAAVSGWAFAGSVLTPLAVLAAAGLDLPLWAFVVAFAGMPVLVAVGQTLWVLGRSHVHLRPRRHLMSLRSVGGLMKLSGLFLVLNLSAALAYQTDTLIVAGVAGASAAAVFTVTLRLFGLVSGLLSSGTQQLWPAMAEAFQRGDVHWVRTRFIRVTGGTAVILTLLCLLLIAVGRPFVRIWAGPTLVPPVALLVAMALWTVYSVFMTQVSYLLNAAEIVGPQVIMALLTAAASLGLSLYLTHRIGISGPILGSLGAHLLCNGVPALLIARRLLREPRPGPA